MLDKLPHPTCPKVQGKQRKRIKNILQHKRNLPRTLPDPRGSNEHGMGCLLYCDGGPFGFLPKASQYASTSSLQLSRWFTPSLYQNGESSSMRLSESIKAACVLVSPSCTNEVIQITTYLAPGWHLTPETILKYAKIKTECTITKLVIHGRERKVLLHAQLDRLAHLVAFRQLPPDFLDVLYVQGVLERLELLALMELHSLLWGQRDLRVYGLRMYHLSVSRTCQNPGYGPILQHSICRICRLLTMPSLEPSAHFAYDRILCLIKMHLTNTHSQT